MDPLGEVQARPGTEKGCGQRFLDHYLGWMGQERREGPWSTTSCSRQEGLALGQRDPPPLAAADEADGGMWIGVWEEGVRDPCPVFPGCDVAIEAGECEA